MSRRTAPVVRTATPISTARSSTNTLTTMINMTNNNKTNDDDEDSDLFGSDSENGKIDTIIPNDTPEQRELRHFFKCQNSSTKSMLCPYLHI